jgi:hypothetical protein
MNTIVTSIINPSCWSCESPLPKTIVTTYMRYLPLIINPTVQVEFRFHRLFSQPVGHRPPKILSPQEAAPASRAAPLVTAMC